MRESTRQTLRHAFFEASFVVLGVVLALAANGWREGRNERALAAEALAGIRDELAVNRAAVDSARAYHEALLDTLGTLAQSGAPAADMRLFARGFVSPATVLATAWDAAVNTDAVHHMAYADVLAASRVYARQAAYEEQARTFGHVIYGRIYEGGTAEVARNYRNLTALISTFWWREGQLVAAYDQALAELDAGADD